MARFKSLELHAPLAGNKLLRQLFPPLELESIRDQLANGCAFLFHTRQAAAFLIDLQPRAKFLKIDLEVFHTPDEINDLNPSEMGPVMRWVKWEIGIAPDLMNLLVTNEVQPRVELEIGKT